MNIKSLTMNIKSLTSNHEHQITNHEHQITNHEHQITNHEHQITNCNEQSITAIINDLLNWPVPRTPDQTQVRNCRHCLLKCKSVTECSLSHKHFLSHRKLEADKNCWDECPTLPSLHLEPGCQQRRRKKLWTTLDCLLRFGLHGHVY